MGSSLFKKHYSVYFFKYSCILRLEVTMTFFPEPLRPSEGREKDEYRVNPIEADKHGKESFDMVIEEEKKKRNNLYGAFLVFCKSLIDNLDLHMDEEGEVSEDELSANVKEFKNFLEILKSRDHNEKVTFYKAFAQSWIRLLQDVHVLAHTKKVVSIDPKKLSILVTEISYYPPNEDHKLGYYLSLIATKDWLPVPFREIIKQLYSDHVVNQRNSFLSKWIDLIEDLLQR